jgi:hypothetical protein
MATLTKVRDPLTTIGRTSSLCRIAQRESQCVTERITCKGEHYSFSQTLNRFYKSKEPNTRLSLQVETHILVFY